MIELDKRKNEECELIPLIRTHNELYTKIWKQPLIDPEEIETAYDFKIEEGALSFKTYRGCEEWHCIDLIELNNEEVLRQKYESEIQRKLQQKTNSENYFKEQRFKLYQELKLEFEGKNSTDRLG
jgi:hypothetical protein